MVNKSSSEHIQEKVQTHSLFLPISESYQKDLLILADKPGDILEIERGISLAIDGYELLSHLIRNPLTDEKLIQKRKKEIARFLDVDTAHFSELLERNSTIKNLFGIEFSDNLGLDSFIRYFKSCEFLYSHNDNAMSFGSSGMQFHHIQEIGEIIPDQIQSIRGIGGEFFSGIADELDVASGKLRKFPIAKVLEILQKLLRASNLENKFYRYHHENRIKKVQRNLMEQLYDIYSEFMKDIQEFAKIYRVIDALVILQIWIRNGYLLPSSFSTGEERGENIRDARHLLNGKIDLFESHIPNHLSQAQYPIEIYCGANGGGKSTWLKTRLSLQLFHQSFGYVPGENVHLPVRDAIVFMNRGGSGYGENLSAFGSDVKKLNTFLPKVWDNTLIIMDEFGSTVPEHEAYAFSRALIEFFNNTGAKTLFSTHNEELLRVIESKMIPGTIVYHPPAVIEKGGMVRYPRTLRKGVDIAHTLDIFAAEGFPKSILSEARIAESEGVRIKSKPYTQLVPHDVGSYTPEEREKLKTIQGKAFAGFSRYNELLIVPTRYGPEFVYKYRPIEYRRNFPEHSVIPNNNGQIESLGNVKDASEDVDLVIIGDRNSQMYKAYHLYPEDYRSQNIWERTLEGLTTYGLTKDPKELLERQIFFEELGKEGYQYFNDIYKKVNHFAYIDFLLRDDVGRGGHRDTLNFDYSDLGRFNLVIWEHLMKRIAGLVVSGGDYYYSTTRNIIEDILAVIELERLLDHIPLGFDNEIQQLRNDIQRYLNLIDRERRAGMRHYESRGPTARKVQKRVWNLLDTEFQDFAERLRNSIGYIYEKIHGTPQGVDIMKLSIEKRTEVGEFLTDKMLFCSYESGTIKKRESSYASNGIQGMLDIIRAMGGSGNLLTPFYAKLRSLDSVHAHQMANYFEELIILPNVEELIAMVQERINVSKGKKNKNTVSGNRKEKNNFSGYMMETHSSSAFFEFLGIASVAEMIQKEGWAKATYNETGDIIIRQGYHPGKEKLAKEKQVKNDFTLRRDQSFDILEGATMGGKTMSIQSVNWIIRLAQSIGYVPAESASISLFDGIIYIDRILEDEGKKLSAGQNDARYWKKLIQNIQARIVSESSDARYWWSIDEMISSVPQRYQRGLVIAILETLKSLGQRGQISIHNPRFVSKLLDLDSEHYTVHHPEVNTHNEEIIPTHRIIPGRSVDSCGNFSAFSIETAHQMGVPDFIIREAKGYRSENIL